MTRILFLAVMAIVSLAVAGCATRRPSSGQEGAWEFYQLSQRNVVQQDLTRPVGPDNPQVAVRYDHFPSTL